MPDRVVRAVRRRPFLTMFLLLALWNGVTTYIGYASNQGRVSDNKQRIDDIQRLRIAKARRDAVTDYNLCNGLNQVRSQIRRVVIEGARSRERLGVPAKGRISEQTVRRIAARPGPHQAYAQQLLPFLNEFADKPCGPKPPGAE